MIPVLFAGSARAVQLAPAESLRGFQCAALGAGNHLDVAAVKDFNGACAHAAGDNHFNALIAQEIGQEPRLVPRVGDGFCLVVVRIIQQEGFTMPKMLRHLAFHACYRDDHNFITLLFLQFFWSPGANGPPYPVVLLYPDNLPRSWGSHDCIVRSPIHFPGRVSVCPAEIYCICSPSSCFSASKEGWPVQWQVR